MARTKSKSSNGSKDSSASLGFEAKLWLAGDKLRNNMDAAEYNRKTPEQIDAAVRQLVSKAITTEGQVIDVFTAAGLPRPDISILSDQFLAEVRGLKYKNVAKRNLVQSQLFRRR